MEPFLLRKTKDHLDSYIKSFKELSPKSQNDRRAVVKMFLNWCSAKDFLRHHHRLFEAVNFKAENSDTANIDFYRPKEMQDILDAAGAELVPVIAVGGLARLPNVRARNHRALPPWRTLPDRVQNRSHRASTRQGCCGRQLYAMSAQPLEKYQSMGSVGDVEVGLPDMVPLDEEATSAMLRMGYVKRVQEDFGDLAAIGTHVQGIGALKVTRGMAMPSQKALIVAIQELKTQIERLGAKPKQTRLDFTSITQLSRELGGLAAELTSSQKFLLGDENHSLSEIEEELPRVKSFAPGAEVRPCGSLTPRGD